jgi:RND family efflux transporter MFP subunit
MDRLSKHGTVTALVAVAGLVACHAAPPPAKPAVASGPSRTVRTAAVARSGAEGVASVPGVVAARQRATLASRISATVLELPLREGERAEAGAVLVRLADASLRSAEAAADAADNAAQTDLERTRKLLAKDAATPQEADGATARAAAARAALLGARDNLSYAVLRAPFAGVVAARPVHVGDVVSPATPLLELEGEAGLEIHATLDGASAARLRSGQRLRAEVDGQAAPLAATVRSVSPAADPATHRFELRADVSPAPGLRSGVFARLLVPEPGAQARLTAPAAALVRRGGLTGLFVVSDGHARLRWVALGDQTDAEVEVRAGVDAGERVVLEPADLADGQAVEALEAVR